MAQTLGVDGIVEGSICRSGRCLRADVRLLEGITGFQRWAQTYERNAADVLIVQPAPVALSDCTSVVRLVSVAGSAKSTTL